MRVCPERMSQLQYSSEWNYQSIPRKPVASRALYEPVTTHNIEQQNVSEWAGDRSPITEPEIAGLRRKRRSLFIVWWLEIACCLVTVAMLLTIIFILRPYHGKTPVRKLPYHISINTVLAILTTILKACSLVILAEGLSQLKWEHFKSPTSLRYLVSYDTASRGPWGCLALISSLGPRHFLGTSGAILSILFIIADPFTQQLVQYSFCTVPATNGSIANISRTSAYWANRPAHATDSEALNLDQKNAILAGLFSPDGVKVPTECPTGNCTYTTPYATIAFCSSCDDVTDELTYSYYNTTLRGEPTTFYNSTLPSGLWAAVTDDGLDTVLFSMGVLGGTLAPHEMITETVVEMILGRSPPATGNYSPPTGLYAESWGENTDGNYCTYAWQNETWGCRGQGAARCLVKPCVQVLSGSVDSAIPSENVLDMYTDWFHGVGSETYSNDQLVMADLSCVNDTTKAQLHSLGHNVTGSRFIPYDVALWVNDTLTQLNVQINSSGFDVANFPALSSEQMSLVPKECIYQVSGSTAAAMHNFYAETFAQQVSITLSESILMGEIQALRVLNNTYISIKSVNETFNAMAGSLSMLARQAVYFELPVYSNPAQGIVMVAETCVTIRWPWIIYPAILTVLTVGFLLAVILHTDISGRDVSGWGWKSSLLPLIYYGVNGSGEDTSLRKARLSDIRQMEKAAKKDVGSIASSSSSLLTTTYDDTIMLRPLRRSSVS